MEQLYLEDVELNKFRTSGDYLVTKNEIIEFATKYDLAPRHIDEEAASKSVFNGLTASSAHIFAIVIALVRKTEPGMNFGRGLGWDELRIPLRVRPSDKQLLDATVIEKREWESRPDRGIIRSETERKNQRGEVVLSAKSTVLVARRS